MALRTAIGTIDCPAATGSQSISGLGFTPKAVFFWCTTRTSAGGGADIAMSIGVATGSSEQFALGMNGTDAAATSNTSQGSSNADAVFIPNAAGSARVLEASLTSLDSDGFTLNWQQVISGVDVHWIAFGGLNLTNAKAGSFTKLSSGTGNQSITSVGFQPDVLFLLPSRLTTTQGVSTAAYLSLGVAKSPSEQWSVGVYAADNSATSYTKRLYYSSALLSLNQNIVFARANLTAFTSNGFDLNYVTNGTGAEYVGYLALKGIDVDVGTITVPASAGSQVITGAGFKPSALMMFGVNGPGSDINTTNINELDFTLGAAISSASRRSTWTGDLHNSANMVSKTYTNSSFVYTQRSRATTPVEVNSANVTSFDDDGFTLNWSAVAEQNEAIYVAFGPTAGNRLGAAALSATGNLTATARSLRAGRASLSGTGSLSAAGRRNLRGAASLSATGSLVATGRRNLRGAASLSASGSLSATGRRNLRGATSLSASGALTATARMNLRGAAALSATGSLVAAPRLNLRGSAALSATGVLVAVPARELRGLVSLSGASGLVAAGRLDLAGMSALSGVSNLTAMGGRIVPGAVALAGEGTLVAVSIMIASGHATLGGASSLSAGGSLNLRGASALSGASNLTAASRLLIAGASALSAQGVLVAGGSLSLSGHADLAGEGSLAAMGSRLILGNAALSASSDLLASGSLILFGSAALSGEGTLSALPLYEIEFGGMVRGGVLVPIAVIRVASPDMIETVRSEIASLSAERGNLLVPIAILRDGRPIPLVPTRSDIDSPFGIIRETR